ncbi:MAG TPA: hypothetical protein VMS76_14280 [Planctomycetota bacterium]|nr:hypothetical protein [Planctomycetota bacterium]
MESTTLSVNLRSRRRAPLPWIVLALGISVPVLPRLVVPLAAPGWYVDDFRKTFLEDPLPGLGMLAWNSAPFALLALFAWLHLLRRDLAPAVRRARRAGIWMAAVPVAALGWWWHVPQTAYGMNFAVAFYTFYALALMPVGYAAGRLAARLFARRS